MSRSLNSLAIALFLMSYGFAQQTSETRNSKENEGASIVYSQGGAFMVDGPRGWTIDRENGQQHGLCCVYYPKGSTWDDAETVMYPNIATKRPGQETLEKFMAADLKDFRDHNPEMKFENAEDVPLKNKRVAKVRLFYNVNQGSFEAVAYVDEEKIIALVVLSSKTKKGLNNSIPQLRSVLQSYSYMDVRFANGQQQEKKRDFELPKE